MNRIKQLSDFLEKNPDYIYGFVCLLLFPALFINLGLFPFNLDEATRAVVALEMKLSGNYILPTINGEFYYNKPPLFNWIQMFFVTITGSMQEWVFRLPAVLSLIGFGMTVFFTLRKELGKRVALFTALTIVTSFRILLYDSFKGLIDISFSWVIYLNFWIIYSNFSKERFFRLFIISWFLTAIGFLLKGMPSIVFQGISLLVYFTYQKSFRKLFSFAHISGGLVFLMIAGGYLMLYSRENSISHYLANLWSESAKRTPIENSFFATIIHLFKFPVDFIYSFSPWSLLIVFLFVKGIIDKVKKEKLLIFLAIMFISNIIVYWVSPAIYPRYLFMFLPSFYAVLAFAYFSSNENSPYNKYFFIPLFHTVVILFPITLSLLPLVFETTAYPHFWLKILFLGIFVIILTYLYVRFTRERVFIILGFSLLGRIGFNFFVFDERIRSGNDGNLREGVTQAAQMTLGSPLYLYEDCPIHNVSTFYIERERKEIVYRWNGDMEKGNLYIVPELELTGMPPHKVITSFRTNLDLLKLSIIEPE